MSIISSIFGYTGVTKKMDRCFGNLPILLLVLVMQAKARSCDMQQGVCYHDAKPVAPIINTTNATFCCDECAKNPACELWLVNLQMKVCFLKVAPTDKGNPGNCITGRGPPPPPYKPIYPTPPNSKNVLFLAVDDMRANIGAYNFTLSSGSFTPNFDKFAQSALRFDFAYVQYAFCSPSRNSFMSGRRPDTTRVWEFEDHFREPQVGPNWVTLPQYFKQFGYLTLGGGKLYVFCL
eukprot:m.38853 g.38853  ORF g.38853 m.38853 type:complete len:235 (-) comp9484_c0_seq2:17-721(-)